jgi:hypothetical protein
MAVPLQVKQFGLKLTHCSQDYDAVLKYPATQLLQVAPI